MVTTNEAKDKETKFQAWLGVEKLKHVQIITHSCYTVNALRLVVGCDLFCFANNMRSIGFLRATARKVHFKSLLVNEPISGVFGVS